MFQDYLSAALKTKRPLSRRNRKSIVMIAPIIECCFSVARLAAIISCAARQSRVSILRNTMSPKPLEAPKRLSMSSLDAPLRSESPALTSATRPMNNKTIKKIKTYNCTITTRHNSGGKAGARIPSSGPELRHAGAVGRGAIGTSGRSLRRSRWHSGPGPSRLALITPGLRTRLVMAVSKQGAHRPAQAHSPGRTS